MSETYKVVLKCRNCGHIPKKIITNGAQEQEIGPKHFTIPTGTTVKQFLQDITAVCENCGCDGFMGIL